MYLRCAKPAIFTFGVVALVGADMGCGYRSKTRVVSAADLADPARTRMTNYMSAPLRPGSPSEETPSAVSRSVLLDEVRIAKLSNQEACFDVLVRTHVSLDSPLSEWNAKVNEREAYFGEERINVRDYSYSSERDVLVAEGVTATAFASLRLTEPTENIYRVVERLGQTCVPVTNTSKIVLELELPQDDLRGSWGEIFEWKIR